jgi:hypothetical protein
LAPSPLSSGTRQGPHHADAVRTTNDRFTYLAHLLLDRAGIVRVRTNDLGDIERELLTVKDL